MKTYTSSLFSSSPKKGERLQNHQNKIEMVSCFRNEMVCKEQLSLINENYRESDSYRSNKNYQKSIEKLRDAFYKTTELNDNACFNCSVIFRATIIDSLKNIKKEIKDLTIGFFGNKNYESSYLMAGKVLVELEKAALFNSPDRKKTKIHVIDSYLKKSAI